MESQSRNRRSVGALRSRDPFEGFGFGGGNGFFSDFVHRDPFDDPFFTQPFGSIFGSSDRFFGSFGGHQAGHFVDERPDAQQQGHRGPVIEELPDDHEENSNAFNSKSNEEPIVEHPDDDVKPHNPAYVRNRDIYSKHDNLSSSQPRNVCQSYSFSSVTYGGPGGTYYKSSTTRRAGANGVIEEEHEEQDSTIGQETKRLSRGLGKKGHSVTRKRNAKGEENYVETLHNLREEEKNDFDQTWRKQAEKFLPGWNKRQEQTLESGQFGSGRHSRAALPWNMESSWRWPWSNHA